MIWCSPRCDVTSNLEKEVEKYAILCNAAVLWMLKYEWILCETDCDSLSTKNSLGTYPLYSGGYLNVSRRKMLANLSGEMFGDKRAFNESTAIFLTT